MLSKTFFLAFLVQLATHACAFAPTHSSSIVTSVNTRSASVSSISKIQMIGNELDVLGNNLETMNTIVTNTPFMISETEAWVQPLASVLGPFLNIFSFAMVR